MAVTVNLNALDKAQQKEIRKVYYMIPGKPTVAQMRDMLIAGPVGTAVYTTLSAALLTGLGFLFLPLLIAVPFAFLVVPYKIAQANRVWNSVLPADRADEQVVLA